ncbi:hypothetical protein LZ554_000198 [Drepanopeziza brunnea f. sp. 'monogermtubi']|nr:hypothetical protein LZ554_000198 [Drepanopeziza brunnea f. sp. 'monogermtubi']
MATPVEADVTPKFKPFTKAERIQQLNDIDKSVHLVLKSAGMALKTLSATQHIQEETTAERKAGFEAASDSLISHLVKVDVGLRRNVWGLEEASIIVTEKVNKVTAQTGNGLLGRPKQEAEAADVSSMGKLDIGWLNSRSGRVGRDMEAELWGNFRKFLEEQRASIKGDAGTNTGT